MVKKHNDKHTESNRPHEQKTVVEDLQKQLSEKELALQDATEKHLRALADYHNLVRRTKDTESLLIKTANASLMEKILSNLDHLLLAQKNLNDKGLQMVIDGFFQTLNSEGLTEIKSDGQTFDPFLMDCVELVSGPKDRVMETTSKGFLLYDKTLRPAKVKVGSGE